MGSSATGKPSINNISTDFSGGLIPEQMALAQYTYGQDAVKNASTFSAGMGHSTNLTQADAGALMGEAQNVQKMSQADTTAKFNYDKALLQQQNTIDQANQQAKASGISNLGSQLGALGGSTGGLSGNSGGSP